MIDKDILLQQINELMKTLRQQHELLDNMLETCRDLKGGLPKSPDHNKDGLYIMIGSSVFFVLGIPAGIAYHNLTLILTEVGVGLLFFTMGFILHRKNKSNPPVASSHGASGEGEK